MAARCIWCSPCTDLIHKGSDVWKQSVLSASNLGIRGRNTSDNLPFWTNLNNLYLILGFVIHVRSAGYFGAPFSRDSAKLRECGELYYCVTMFALIWRKLKFFGGRKERNCSFKGGFFGEKWKYKTQKNLWKCYSIIRRLEASWIPLLSKQLRKVT